MIFSYTYATVTGRVATSLLSKANQFHILALNQVSLFASMQAMDGLVRIVILQLSGWFLDWIGREAGVVQRGGAARASKKLGVVGHVLDWARGTAAGRVLFLFAALELYCLVATAAMALRASGYFVAASAVAEANSEERTAGSSSFSLPLILQLTVSVFTSFSGPVTKMVPFHLGLAEKELVALNSWEISGQKVAKYLAPVLVGVLLPILPFDRPGIFILLFAAHAFALLAKLVLLVCSAFGGRPSTGSERSSGSPGILVEKTTKDARGRESPKSPRESPRKKQTPKGQRTKTPQKQAPDKSPRKNEKTIFPKWIAGSLDYALISMRRDAFAKLLVFNTLLSNFFVYPFSSVLLPVVLRRVANGVEKTSAEDTAGAATAATAATTNALWIRASALISLGGVVGPLLSSLLVVADIRKTAAVDDGGDAGDGGALPRRLCRWTFYQICSLVVCIALVQAYDTGNLGDSTIFGGGVSRLSGTIFFGGTSLADARSVIVVLISASWALSVCFGNLFTIYFNTYSVRTYPASERGRILANMLVWFSVANAAGNAALGAVLDNSSPSSGGVYEGEPFPKGTSHLSEGLHSSADSTPWGFVVSLTHWVWVVVAASAGRCFRSSGVERGLMLSVFGCVVLRGVLLLRMRAWVGRRRKTID